MKNFSSNRELKYMFIDLIYKKKKNFQLIDIPVSKVCKIFTNGLLSYL